MRQKLVTAALRYDVRQSRGRRHNPYALAQYLMRVDEVMADIARGAEARAAIVAGFTGPLLAALLRAAGLEKPTRDELTGTGKWGYSPVTQEPDA